MTLSLYILRRYLIALFQVLLVISLIVLLFTALDNMRSISRYDLSAADVTLLTLLESPEILGEALPLVVMLGALTAFLRLARSSEMVVIRASAVSAWKALLFPVIASFLLGVLAFGAINPMVAAARLKVELLKEEFLNSGRNVLSVSDRRIWLRQGDDEGQAVIEAARVNTTGTRLFQVRMHRFNTSGDLTERIEAHSAQLSEGRWILTSATLWPLDPYGDMALPEPQVAQLYTLPTSLTSDQILDSFSPPEMVGFWQLPRFIQSLEDAGFSATRHRLQFQIELAKPLLFAAMALIGAGFSLRHTRFGQAGVMILTAVLSGFLLYFFKDVTESLGASRAIPVSLAAWSPPLVAIMLAVGFILHVEDG